MPALGPSGTAWAREARPAPGGDLRWTPAGPGKRRRWRRPLRPVCWCQRLGRSSEQEGLGKAGIPLRPAVRTTEGRGAGMAGEAGMRAASLTVLSTLLVSRAPAGGKPSGTPSAPPERGKREAVPGFEVFRPKGWSRREREDGGAVYTGGRSGATTSSRCPMMPVLDRHAGPDSLTCAAAVPLPRRLAVSRTLVAMARVTTWP